MFDRCECCYGINVSAATLPFVQEKNLRTENLPSSSLTVPGTSTLRRMPMFSMSSIVEVCDQWQEVGEVACV